MGELYHKLIDGHVLVLDGVGVGVAAALVLALRVSLPEHERKRARGPALLLLLHVLLVLPRVALDQTGTLHRVLGLGALFVLILSIGRAGFAFLLHGVLARGRAQPWPKIFRDIVEGLVYVVAAFFTLQGAGVEPGSLLTTSALLTAVIGLSLQDTLGNLFAGLAIQAQRPFDVGDWVQYGDRVAEAGRVVEINWRATKILTFDDVELVIPNGPLARGVLRNFSKPNPRTRRSLHVVVPFETPPHRVHDAIVAALRDVDGVLATPEPSVLTDSFGERGVDYWVRFHIDDFARREQVEGAVHDRVWYALSRIGVELAVPMANLTVRTVDADHVGSDASTRRRALEAVDFLARLPAPALEQLAAESRWASYGPGEVVVRQGEAGQELFVVSEGTCIVRSEGSGDRSRDVARLGAGDFFGERAILTGEARIATVEAASGARLVVVPKSALQHVLDHNPALAGQISVVVAQRAGELERLGLAAIEESAGTAKGSGSTAPFLLDRIKDFFSLPRA